MTFTTALSWVYQGFPSKNRNQLCLLTYPCNNLKAKDTFLEEEIMLRFYLRLFSPMLIVHGELINNNPDEITSFLNYQYQQNKGKEVEFLSFLEFSLEFFNYSYLSRYVKEYDIDEDIPFSITNLECQLNGKKVVKSFIFHKLHILHQGNHSGAKRKSVESSQLDSTIQLALLTYYRQKGKLIAWFNGHRGNSRVGYARNLNKVYGISIQNFVNQHTRISHPKKGEQYRRRKSQFDNLQKVCELLQEEPEALKFAKVDFDFVSSEAN